MKNPLQHSNSRVAGEELSDPMARGSRNELWTAARVLELRGSARGGEVRNSEGRGGGLDARRGEGEGRGMGEVGDSTRGEGRGRGKEGRGRGGEGQGRYEEGRGRGEEGRGRGEAASKRCILLGFLLLVGARLARDCCSTARLSCCGSSAWLARPRGSCATARSSRCGSSARLARQRGEERDEGRGQVRVEGEVRVR
jgi:hypothetical protein